VALLATTKEKQVRMARAMAPTCALAKLKVRAGIIISLITYMPVKDIMVRDFAISNIINRLVDDMVEFGHAKQFKQKRTFIASRRKEQESSQGSQRSTISMVCSKKLAVKDSMSSHICRR